MYLSELLRYRAEPAAGLFMALTRRCPLSCEHCSTNSTLHSEEVDESTYLDFADTFSAEQRPEMLSLTGGEPLLRPHLVIELARRAHAVGTRVAMITGMFFARKASHARVLDEAIDSVDHITASLDFFHEREVDRQQVFPEIQRMLDRGKDVSFQLTGGGPTDTYLTGLIADIRERFDDRVPMFVSRLGASGRGRELVQLGRRKARAPEAGLNPCRVASWPVVAFDGSIVTCCNQDVVDGKALAPHLRLGHASHMTWPDVAREMQTRWILRGLRTVGPEYLSQAVGRPLTSAEGFCGTCKELADDPAVLTHVEAFLRAQLTPELELAIRDVLKGSTYTDPAFLELSLLGDRHAA